MEMNTMSLLQKCKENFPYIKWEENGSDCMGSIEGTPFTINVSTGVNVNTGVKLLSVTLRLLTNENSFDLIGTYDHKGQEIETLFDNFRSEWERLNSLLNTALKK